MPRVFTHGGVRYEPLYVQMYGREDWVVRIGEVAEDGVIFEGHRVLFGRVDG
jgi:hypothetical protein